MMSFTKILHDRIATYLRNEGVLTNEDYIDEDLFEDVGYIEFLKLEGISISNELESFVELMKALIPEDDPKASTSLPTNLISLLIPSLHFNYIPINTDTKKYHRKFDYTDVNNQRGAITSIFDINMHPSSQVTAILYHFFETASDNLLADFIKGQIEDKPYILLFSVTPINNTYDLFCNIFSCYIAIGENIQISPNLDMIQVENSYGTNLHDNNAQYFPLVDYLNEINKSSDILNQYLKSYRIVEYLVWRSLITGIVNSNEFTVTNFLNAVENKNNELTTLEKRFPKIFQDLSLIISLPAHEQVLIDGIFNQADSFLKTYRKKDKLLERYNDLKLHPADNTKKKDFLVEIIRTIYFFRNAVAHNKYSEFSISYWNYELYQDVIPLVHLLIKFIFNNTIMLLTQNRSNEIHFDRQQLDLF